MEDALNQNYNGDNSISTPGKKFEADYGDEEKLVLKFYNFANIQNVLTHIRRFLKPACDEIKISKDLITVKFAVKNDGHEEKIIRDISTPLDSKSAHHLRMWFDVVYPITRSSDHQSNGVTVKFDYFTTFYFPNTFCVALDKRHISDQYSGIKLDVKSAEIVIRFKTCLFVIQPLDMDDIILINEKHNYFEIFLCLKNPPKFCKDGQRSSFDFNSQSFNFYLRSYKGIDPKISFDLRKSLERFCSRVVNVCNLRKDEMKQFPSFNFGNFYKTYLASVWFCKHAAVLPPNIPTEILEFFGNIKSNQELEIVLNNFQPERFKPLNPPALPPRNFQFPKEILPTNCVSIGRIKLTPSRTIFMPARPVSKNRVFRIFPDSKNFLIVSFTDEHGRNPWVSKDITSIFYDTMLKGIIVAGKRYNFLGCSKSQLNEGKCWFTCLNPQMVYDRIGKFPSNWSAGRKLTRISLAFSATTETIPINTELYISEVHPDVENEEGKCFSDGIGRASRAVFYKISDILNLPPGTSALQIRVGGVKGVISVFDQQEDVTFRKSMKKFESQHNTLEVLNFSRSHKMALNRHVILQLSSFGVPDEIFLELQYDVLEKVIEALTDDGKALSFVKSQSTTFDWHMFNAKQIVQEPFFRQILISNAIALISSIIDHAHIPVEQGRLLMGVLDETGTLEYGEVYAHIIEPDFELEVEGKVVIFRNPCVLPSDVRKVNARTKGLSDQFKNLYRNCLVFPSRGPVSHAHECSGGDLDGDLYYICWDQRLLPPNLPEPGVEVEDIKIKEMTDRCTENHYGRMIGFYCDFQSNRQLGIIANAHLATIDKFGIYDKKSIQLARCVTAETDAPITGYTVGKIGEDLIPKEYPDYMQKSDKPSYQSKTILGKLFRQANPFMEILIEKKSPIIFPSRVMVTDNQLCVENFYQLYCFEIKKILEKFDLQCEVDLFSGTPAWNRNYAQAYREKAHLAKTLLEVVTAFWKKWKLEFERFRAINAFDPKKIKEWYERPKSCLWPAHSFSLLAFPHVDIESYEHKTIAKSINDSTIFWVNSNKIDWLTQFTKREKVGKALMEKLDGVECHFYGSSMLGLSEEYSDIDLFAGGDLQSLQTILQSLDENARAMKKPHNCVSMTYDNYSVDITNFAGGVYKTYAVAEVFDKNPSYWTALRVIIEWARTVKIVKSGGSKGIMTVISLCHLFIYHATNSAPRTVDRQTEYSFQRMNNWLESVNGDLIFNFLKFISSRKNAKWIASKVDPVTSEFLIESELVEEMCKSAKFAVFILGVYEGDIEKLIQVTTKKRLFKIQSEYLSPSTTTQEQKNQKLSEIESLCNLENCHEMLSVKNGAFYLEVAGDHKRFQEVEAGLGAVYCRLRYFKKYMIWQESFFIKEGTCFVLENGGGKDQKVFLETYNSQFFHPQHSNFFKASLRTDNVNPNWRSSEFQNFKSHFLEQMKKYKSKLEEAKDNPRLKKFFGELMCQIRVGSHYILNPAEEFMNKSEMIPLQRVIKEVSEYAENLSIMKTNKIISSTYCNPKLALIRKISGPLILRPLKVAKNIADKKQIAAKARKNLLKNRSMRHSFYTTWTFGAESSKSFAAQNGFKETSMADVDFYVSCCIVWMTRDRIFRITRKGRINDIRNRKTRWISSTFKRSNQYGGPDIRSYLETQAYLDEEANCLNTFKLMQEDKSIFTKEFVDQLNGNEPKTWHEKPLIPEMFSYDWGVQSMRIHTPIAKYINSHGDVLIQNKIHDGIFRDDETFLWQEEHEELEIRMNIKDSSDEELCERSYDLSLKLFDFTKA